jgi:hypothetical protein
MVYLHIILGMTWDVHDVNVVDDDDDDDDVAFGDDIGDVIDDIHDDDDANYDDDDNDNIIMTIIWYTLYSL